MNQTLSTRGFYGSAVTRGDDSDISVEYIHPRGYTITFRALTADVISVMIRKNGRAVHAEWLHTNRELFEDCRDLYLINDGTDYCLSRYECLMFASGLIESLEL